MSNTINTVIGAFIAAIIAFLTTFLALFVEGEAQSLADIKEATWIVLGVGVCLSFAKDFQAIWTREKLSAITKVPEK